MLKLRLGFVLGFGLERLLQLLGGHLPSRNGSIKLLRVRRRNSVEFDRGVSFQYMRALLSGILLFRFGGLSLYGMHRWKGCFLSEGNELCYVRRRSLRGIYESISMFRVLSWAVPDGHGRNGLRELSAGSIWDCLGS